LGCHNNWKFAMQTSHRYRLWIQLEKSLDLRQGYEWIGQRDMKWQLAIAIRCPNALRVRADKKL
jgi:hypothetical protein